MQPSRLVIKRSQSENLPFEGKIFSPSPIKQASNISSRLASEIFDLSSSAPNVEVLNDHISPMKPLRVRFCSARIEYGTTYEWNSDSSCTTSSQGDCDSPNMMAAKNPYHQEHIFEDISADIPLRASNPIINDANFKQYNQKRFESATQEKLFSRLNALDF